MPLAPIIDEKSRDYEPTSRSVVPHNEPPERAFLCQIIPTLISPNRDFELHYSFTSTSQSLRALSQDPACIIIALATPHWPQ